MNGFFMSCIINECFLQHFLNISLIIRLFEFEQYMVFEAWEDSVKQKTPECVNNTCMDRDRRNKNYKK